MSVLKSLPELLQAEVITPETADKIRDYYNSKESSSVNRLFIVFGILGAILVGLGIILIIAHNWDEFSRTVKVVFAFLPLLAGQVLCGYSLIKQPDSTAWKEASTAFLFFAVGASISLVSQIYNIPGNLSSFLMTWMLLCLPLVYVMKSSVTSLLYIIGITYFACETNYWSYPSTESYWYWLMFAGVLPHYYYLYGKQPDSNFMVMHNWIFPVSLIIALGTVAKNTDELMFIAYMSLFGVFYLVGMSGYFRQQKTRNNSFRVLGSAGTLILLLILSFDGFWEDLRSRNLLLNEIILAPEFYASVVLSLAAAGLFYINFKKERIKANEPFAFIFMLFIVTFIIGGVLPFAVVLINLYVLTIGILTIMDGAKKFHLGILNYGLLIITALVVCRFFDTDLSFVMRGILFVSVGAGFFATNYWMLKKRKTNE
ncbi:MAG: DUF2157 domain-containing protein [Bacteroidia bacterium]